MHVQFRCGCGEVNYNRQDWLAHFKYGLNGKLRALRHLLMTRIELVR